MDAAASGTLLSKTAKEAHKLLEEIWADNFQLLHEVDPIVSILVQVSALANQIAAFNTKEVQVSSSKEAGMVATTSYTGEGVKVEQE